MLARRAEILDVACRHGVRGLRWWPPQPGDFVVAGLPDRLRQLQADLERTLGCRIGIYLIENWADEDRRRLEAETVRLEECDPESVTAAKFTAAWPGAEVAPRTRTVSPGRATRLQQRALHAEA